MKTVLTLFLCLTFSWHFSAVVWADSEHDDARQKAKELLELADKQTHALSIETTKQALALYESANDMAGVADCYGEIGTRYFAQNMMTEATQYYELALQSWQQQSNVEKEAAILISLGYVEGRKGEWLNGISYLTQAQNLIDERNDLTQLARAATGMAYVFNESGLPENGLIHFQRAMEYFRQAGNIPAYNRQMMTVAYTHFLLKNYDEALKQLQQPLQYFEALSDLRSKLYAAECHEYLGRIYLATGEYDLALYHLQPVPAIYESAGNNRDAAQVHALIGQIYERRGAVDRARTIYLNASQIFRQVDDRINDAAVRFALGRLELNRNNYDAAESYLKDSIKTTEDIRQDLSSRVFAAAFSASVHDRYEAYIECLMRKHKQQPAKGLELQAFEASELARARSLAELLSDTQTKIVAGVDPKLAEQERMLRFAIRTKVDQTITLLAGDYKKEDLNTVETSLTRLREQHKRVVQQLQKQNPHYDQIKETANYSVKQIQDLIIEDDQTMLLEYFLGRNASYVWAITRNGAKVFDLKKAGDITQAVRNVYELIKVEPGKDTEQRVNAATSELSKLVLDPVANELNARRIIVVADGALNYIPFQLLPLSSRNRAPLVANYEIVNAPSASVLGQLRQEKQQRPARTKVLAAFGDPAFASNYQQFNDSGSGEILASIKREEAESSHRVSRDIEIDADSVDANAIQSLIYSKFELNNLKEIAGSRSLVAKGFDASREVLEATDFSQYAILHFATHGLLNPKSPENSGFFLSMVDHAGKPQNGFITMQDVYSLQVPVDLVVLSACRTGLGKDVRGEGLIGLTRGFMHAGASSVVASLWKVDDEATAELMKNFYANMLQKNMRPAEALREAQNTLRQNPAWQSPHFWAAFTLQGEFKEPIRLPAPTGTPLRVQKAVGGGLLLALLAGIAWGFRRRYSTSK